LEFEFRRITIGFLNYFTVLNSKYLFLKATNSLSNVKTYPCLISYKSLFTVLSIIIYLYLLGSIASIRMKLYKLVLLCGLSICCLNSFAQPLNDDCVNSERLCSGQPIQGTTTDATFNSSTDDNFCTINSATVWYIFTTNNVGGNVTVDFTNLSFNTDPTFGQEIDAVLFNVTTPCVETSYTPYSTCQNSGTDFSISSAIALLPNTTYYVMVNGSNVGGGVTNSAECTYQVEISGPAVDVTPPTAVFSVMNTVICQGDGELVETVIANCPEIASFDWYYNNILVSSSTDGAFNTSQLAEDGFLKLIIKCGSFCIYSDTTDSIGFSVTPISASAGTDKFIQLGDLATLDGSGVGNAVWSPANSLTDPSSFTPTANPESTTTYFLTVTSGSCIASDSVNVFVGEVITVYSGFSPNGDDINDKWVIRNSAQYPDMEVIVYDRSGQKVFQTTGYSTQDKWWDGTNKGKELPVSTYFYVVDLKIGDDGIFKGQVTIIK
jgi:gliding motility-associated-like protein